MLPLGVLIPVLVLFLMFVVGLGLTTDDLRRVLQRPVLVASLTLAQAFVLPLVAVGVARTLDLPEPIAFGLVLAASCPAGTGSNAYTLLVGGNVALSVTLTAASNAAAFVTLPLGFAAGMSLLAGESAWVTVPAGRLFSEIALVIVLPAALGLAVRRRFPAVWTRAGAALERASLAAIFLLVGLVVADEAAFLRHAWGGAVAAAIAFTACGLVVGGLASMALPDVKDRIAVLVEFPVRNQSLAVLLALRSFGRREVAALAAVIVLTQAAVFLTGRLLFRRGRAATSSIPEGSP
jgi:BASS family bile acid:Na+ symporter